jgi:hypothetical protein
MKMKKIFSFFLVVLFGSIFGFAIGFIIFSFGSLIGKSGNSDAAGIGQWLPMYSAFVSICYGVPFGVLFSIVGYFLFLEKTKITFELLFKLAAFTLLGGIVGALVGPPLAAFLGAVMFLVACKFLATKKTT